MSSGESWGQCDGRDEEADQDDAPGTRVRQVLAEVVRLVPDARRIAARSVNSVMTAAYWEIGRRIVEHEQGGAERAAYGEALLARLSVDLTNTFGRGFSVDRLETARLFYLAYSAPSISATASRKSLAVNSAIGSRISPGLPAARFVLSWSHYVLLVQRGGLPLAREFYEAETVRDGWTVRQLERQIDSQFYERTVLSRNKAAMLKKGAVAKPEDAVTPEEEIKGPVILEFLGLKDEYSESDLEDVLIVKLESFLPKLGGDFTFVGRQRRLRGYRAIGYARGEAPVGYAEPGDEVVVEHDENALRSLEELDDITR